MGALPNLIIIGAMKCGTTSLHHYLNQHPDIRMSQPKELNFFTWQQNWERGSDWYESHFDADFPIRGESTPKYTKYPLSPDVAERMHSVVPETKLIYLVGDPLERIIAHWVDWHAAKLDRAPASVNARMAGRPLDEALEGYDDPAHPYVCPSRYATQLERYLAHFRSDQILVVDQEDLRRRRDDTMQGIFAFLGVGRTFTGDAFSAQLNAGTRKARPIAGYSRLRATALAHGAWRIPSRWRAPVGRPLRRMLSREIDRPSITGPNLAGLRALLGDEANRLRALTGRPFPRWSV